MRRKSYSTDLSDSEWAILAPLIPPAKCGGHPRTTDMRSCCNVLYQSYIFWQNWDAPDCYSFTVIQLISVK